MKTYTNFRLILLIAISLLVYACGQKTNMNEQDGQTEQPAFATPEEAIENAKKDFMEILKTGQDFNLGIDAATLEKSEAGDLLRYADLDFEKIMQADSTTTVEQLISEERTTIVPMIVDENVTTVIALNKDDKGWRITGLAGADITRDLNTVYRAVNDSLTPTITIYEIPNLTGKIYGVNNGTSSLFYTDYAGKFSLRQGVTAQALLAVLREDAIKFQQEFGERLKKGEKLVK